MKNKFKKGDIISLVDENGNDTQSSMWVDRDIEIEKGDIFEIGTTKNAPLTKMECMSNQDFPLVARIIEDCIGSVDMIDEYICPTCGKTSELCNCDDYDDEFEFDYNYPMYDDDDDDYSNDYCFDDDDLEEVVCYLDGKPLTRYNIECMKGITFNGL